MARPLTNQIFEPTVDGVLGLQGINPAVAQVGYRAKAVDPSLVIQSLQNNQRSQLLKLQQQVKLAEALKTRGAAQNKAAADYMKVISTQYDNAFKDMESVGSLGRFAKPVAELGSIRDKAQTDMFNATQSGNLAEAARISHNLARQIQGTGTYREMAEGYAAYERGKQLIADFGEVAGQGYDNEKILNYMNNFSKWAEGEDVEGFNPTDIFNEQYTYDEEGFKQQQEDLFKLITEKDSITTQVRGADGKIREETKISDTPRYGYDEQFKAARDLHLNSREGRLHMQDRDVDPDDPEQVKEYIDNILVRINGGSLTPRQGVVTGTTTTLSPEDDPIDLEDLNSMSNKDIMSSIVGTQSDEAEQRMATVIEQARENGVDFNSTEFRKSIIEAAGGEQAIGEDSQGRPSNATAYELPGGLEFYRYTDPITGDVVTKTADGKEMKNGTIEEVDGQLYYRGRVETRDTKFVDGLKAAGLIEDDGSDLEDYEKELGLEIFTKAETFEDGVIGVPITKAGAQEEAESSNTGSSAPSWLDNVGQ